jgi:hypothetical protein
MPIDWKTPYRTAMGERDRSQLKDLCEAARRAICDRLIELTTAEKAEMAEKDELEEASRALALHEHSQAAPPYA